MREVPIMSTIFDIIEFARSLPNGKTIFDHETKIEKSVVYKTINGEKLKMDIYFPARPLDGKAPAVMVIPGGGWMIRNRERRDGYAKCYAAMGAVVFVIEMRVVPKVFFPDNLIDCIDAYNFIVDNADVYNIDKDNITVTGDSSGGHLSACIGCASSDRSYAEKLNLPMLKSNPTNLIFISGAFSFEVMYRIPFTHLLMVRYVSNTRTRTAFRKWKYYKEINPYNYINANFPESYNNGGMTDLLCLGEAKRFSKVLTKAGVKNEYRVGKNLFNSAHCYVLRFPFPPARRDMLAIYTWYVARQQEKGVDMSEGYKRVHSFFTNYRKELKEYKKAHQHKRRKRNARG